MTNPGETPESGEPAVPGVRLRLRETQMESADSRAGSEPHYYLSRSGEPVGPLSRAQLESMLRTGEADPEEPGWSEGSPDERSVRDLIGDVDVPSNAPADPPPDDGSAFRTEDSLPALLWGSLSYPFQGNGPILLVAGTLFFAFLAVLTRYGTLFGWIPYLMASGYFLTTLQGIVQSTGNGDASPPTWPDITHWVGDLLVPCLKWVGSLAVAFGPAYLCFRMVSSMGGDFAESREFASREQALWLGAALGLFLLGVVYFPMAILGVAMSDSLGALSPRFVSRSIAAVPGPYAAVVAMLLALLFVQGGIHSLIRRVPIPMLDHLTGAFISLYFGFVQARILGVLYRSQRERLGWF